MKIVSTYLFVLIIFSAIETKNAQVKSTSSELLRMEASGFKLVGSKIKYEGETCYPDNITDEAYLDFAGDKSSPEVINIGNEKFFESHRFYRHGRGDGLAVENYSARLCRLYRMFGIYESTSKRKQDGSTPDATRGLFRVGDNLWMGSNGIGAAVLDLKTRTWARYDLKSNAIPGDHLAVNYADEDYVFITRGEFPNALFHIYSIKRDKWLRLASVSTRLVSEYGHSSGTVQISVDHSIYAKRPQMPIDWTFMGIQVTNKESSYLFEKKFTTSKTAFEIDKSELEKAFSYSK